MKKKTRIPPNTLEKQWQEARPQLTKQMLEENPDNPLEVMRYVKQIDEYQRNLTALTALTLDTFEQVNDMFDYEIATLQSKIIQEKRKRKNATNIKLK
ncbi:hypothetical protein AB6889_17405 [Carnobacterium maltaromaticum]|jgi:hypothetical protein|uniref:hypothetical protein n=1 Tax=Carnobacterium maltaromaticum TaxID=2751 RepID=UPI00191BC4FB|nr:hypothetical protein [Carnobacterium maltaromaticum]CAD5902932.1 hypothetical protein CMALT394_560015 [Carnobacterium maltaromaticum]